MRLFKINNIYLNLDNIKQLHVKDVIHYNAIEDDMYYGIFADNVKIYKDFRTKSDAIKQLEKITECIEQGYTRF